MKGDLIEGVSLLLRSSGTTPGLPDLSCAFIDDYEMTDDEIVRTYRTESSDLAKFHPELRGRLKKQKKLVKKLGLRIVLARWPNGVESFLVFPEGNLHPRPVQLLRAYKHAFAARQVMHLEVRKADHS